MTFWTGYRRQNLGAFSEVWPFLLTEAVNIVCMETSLLSQIRGGIIGCHLSSCSGVIYE